MTGFDEHIIDRDFLKQDIENHIDLIKKKLEDLTFNDLRHIEYVLRVLLIKKDIIKVNV